MSPALLLRRRVRRPRLRVVGGVPRPRHRAVFSMARDAILFAVEFWTEAEWAEMAPAERPENAAWCPGVGYLISHSIDEEEREEIAAELRDAREAYEFTRSMGKTGRGD